MVRFLRERLESAIDRDERSRLGTQFNAPDPATANDTTPEGRLAGRRIDAAAAVQRWFDSPGTSAEDRERAAASLRRGLAIDEQWMLPGGVRGHIDRWEHLRDDVHRYPGIASSSGGIINVAGSRSRVLTERLARGTDDSRAAAVALAREWHNQPLFDSGRNELAAERASGMSPEHTALLPREIRERIGDRTFLRSVVTRSPAEAAARLRTFLDAPSNPESIRQAVALREHFRWNHRNLVTRELLAEIHTMTGR
jgi:hypothetical protein